MSSTACKPLQISGIEPESIVDGPGFRYVIFVQGCPHHCPGCHNPQTHPFEGGTTADIAQILRDIDENPLLQGVTFSGGEPFCQAEALRALGEQIKQRGKNLVVYSGYTYEQLLKKGEQEPAVLQLLQLADFLIDGRYEETERNLSLLFRGSNNQRFIDLRGEQPVVVPDEG